MSDDAYEEHGTDSTQDPKFDVDQFLAGLDAIFDKHEAGTKADEFLQQALVDAENAGDNAGLLTVLNETMGFYRSQGRHEDNQWIIQRALELSLRMQLVGSEAWTTTLINAATSLRAAHRYDQAEDLYRQALDNAKQAYSPTDRRFAALHNNLSMLYSETQRLEAAQHELETALHILESSSVNADEDIDIASTNTNLALVILQRASSTQDSSHSSQQSKTQKQLLEEATNHAQRALKIYRTGHLEHSAHYASALAGYAQVCFANGDFARSADTYRHALNVIEECYGTDTDYYRITEANMRQAQEAANQSGQLLESNPSHDANSVAPADSIVHSLSHKKMPHDTNSIVAPASAASPASTSEAKPKPTASQSSSLQLSGLQLSRAYWNEYGKPMLASKYGQYQGRIAAGLVGHGSECYGFDDEFSHDHDFGPGFCLWLTDEDYAAIGERLQADYDALPDTFMGYGPRASTARAQSTRRVGVFSIGSFFEQITGYAQAPAADKPHEWLLLDEPTLAAATNGEIFADPLGAFSRTRQSFKLMPDDVRFALISRRLGMIAQAGQYNMPRMLQRSDSAAAWLSISEFVQATASLVFLLNNPISVGYMPYYKWRFAALRNLSRRMACRLPQVAEQLERILQLSSAACFGGAGFGEGGKGAASAQKNIQHLVESVCAQIVKELNEEGISNSPEQFLEWQRPYVEAHISRGSTVLHSL